MLSIDYSYLHHHHLHHHIHHHIHTSEKCVTVDSLAPGLAVMVIRMLPSLATERGEEEAAVGGGGEGLDLLPMERGCEMCRE